MIYSSIGCLSRRWGCLNSGRCSTHLGRTSGIDTSWTAQHVYLSQAGLLPSFTESSGLKSGHEVASPEKLGFSRIKIPLEST
jgi:hypothetical protein